MRLARDAKSTDLEAMNATALQWPFNPRVRPVGYRDFVPEIASRSVPSNPILRREPSQRTSLLVEREESIEK